MSVKNDLLKSDILPETVTIFMTFDLSEHIHD